LSKERAHLLAGAAHEGISAAVRPSHTRHDGDTVFTLATGEADAPQRDLERLAAQAVADAIRRGVRAATGVPGAPAAAR
jgi:L-aminopeptidase/D-esterase-like protein